ncbi:MAG: hypothetical protein MJ068_01435 [Clostridia bacterium]|nr:hypothetical protein [Clostridia bacterium]
MFRKPIILILTSRDETGNESRRLKEAIQKIGTHNAVIISDERFGKATKSSTLDRLMDSGQEYQYLLETKDKSVVKDLFKISKFSKRITRIVNLLKRFRPEYVLCLTPYSHHAMIEAKKRAKLHIPVIYLMNTFTAPKMSLDDSTNVIIVENPDIKQELVRTGLRSKDIMTMGLPYEMTKLSEEEKTNEKKELGLPDSKTVFINFKDKKILEEIFSLMLDQGGIVNLAVYCDDAKLRMQLAARANKVEGMTALFIQSQDIVDQYLRVCDLAITRYDQSVIYKNFHLGIPSIVLDGGEQSKKDIQYLMNQGLLLRAKEPIDTVALLYKVIHTEEGSQIAKAGEKWVEMSSTDNIAQFLASYIVV